MTIVIGYDGSTCAKAAIADLRRAGLPQDISAHVVSAVEPWPDTAFMSYASAGGGIGLDSALSADVDTLAQNALADAQKLASEGEELVQTHYPHWQVRSESSDLSPADAILSAAEQHAADLVVVGTRGQGALRRLLAGSTSQKVMRYARCSVRGVHEHAEHATGPLRLIIAYDGSPQSQLVLHEVLRRTWPSATTACVLTVFEIHHVLRLPRQGARDEAISTLQQQGESAAQQLREVGIEAQAILRSGDAKHVLLNEASQWGADCIFLGPHGLGRARRFLVGSVSASVFAGAPCTVEVVRTSGT